MGIYIYIYYTYSLYVCMYVCMYIYPALPNPEKKQGLDTKPGYRAILKNNQGLGTKTRVFPIAGFSFPICLQACAGILAASWALCGIIYNIIENIYDTSPNNALLRETP